MTFGCLDIVICFWILGLDTLVGDFGFWGVLAGLVGFVVRVGWV